MPTSVVHLLLSEPAPDAADRVRAALPELPADAVRPVEPHRLAVAFDAPQITAGAIAGRLFPLLQVADPRIGPRVGQPHAG